MKVRGPRADRPRDYRQAIHEFSRSLTLVVDEDQLRAAIPAKLREFFGLERVAIFLREGDGAPFRVASARGIEAPVADAAAFPADGRLARWLKVNEMPLVLAEQPGVVDFLDAGERDTLRSLGAAACFPLVALNQLRGFLAVGPTGRGPALGLDPGERELLGVLAGQAALAFENAALIREQRDRLKRLYRAERLATAGEMAAGAAHEIRNPLTSIRSAIQHLRGDYEDASPRAELIDDILAEVDRINEIVEALLSFARPAQVKFESVDLAELVRQTVALIDARARKCGVTVEVDGPESLPFMADGNLIKQVVLNVAMNALQAMPEGGTLSIAVERVGAAAEIRVEDTGCGITPEDRERIFDPFFTTKKEGTGLGLSVCYGIVQRHGGEIEVDSEIGVGTTLKVRLPGRHG
jgi:signal transduction histidine kinase